MSPLKLSFASDIQWRYYPIWSHMLCHSLRPWRRYRTIFLRKSIAAWPDLEGNSCNYTYRIFIIVYHSSSMFIHAADSDRGNASSVAENTSTILTLEPEGTPIESPFLSRLGTCLRSEALSQGASNYDLRQTAGDIWPTFEYYFDDKGFQDLPSDEVVHSLIIVLSLSFCMFWLRMPNLPSVHFLGHGQFESGYNSAMVVEHLKLSSRTNYTAYTI